MKIRGNTYSYVIGVHKRGEPFYFIFWIILSFLIESSALSVFICVLFFLLGYLHMRMIRLLFRMTKNFSEKVILSLQNDEIFWVESLKPDDDRFNIRILLKDLEYYSIDSLFGKFSLEVTEKNKKLHQLTFHKTEMETVKKHLSDIVESYGNQTGKSLRKKVNSISFIRYFCWPLALISIIYNLRFYFL